MATSRRTHVSPYKPVQIRPAQGGRLMTYTSADVAGSANYTVKRDFRRILDREVRDAGYTNFWPNTSLPLGNQWIPSGSLIGGLPVTLLHQSRLPNGELAVIAGTATTLYRYFSLVDGSYYQGDGTPSEYYLGSDYYQSNYGSWLVIGSGFQASAQRWEVVDNNGWTIFNNGIDLPVTYQVSDFAVKPIYELREVGIASVGNITVCNDYLLCADVSEISDTSLVDILTPISAGSITAQQTGIYSSGAIGGVLAFGSFTSTAPVFSADNVGATLQCGPYSGVISSYFSPTDVGTTISPIYEWSGSPFYIIGPYSANYTVTSSAPFFTAAMVGRQILWDSGNVRTITQFIDSQHVVVDSYQPVPSGTFSLNNPAAYAPFTDGANINRIAYRIINGIPGAPRRWGSTVPGSTIAGTIFLTFEYPALSFFEIVGQQITVLGAGVDGGNLTAVLSYLAPNGMDAILDTPAVATVTNALVQAADATGANIGYVDLQDDGSGIIGMLDLLGNLIVYKDTSIFIGQYAGTQGSPFNFGKEPAYSDANGGDGSKSLYHRYTLLPVVENGIEFHVYAGRNSLFRFDMIYQEPIELKTGEFCKNLFFENATLPSATDPISTFAFDNPITKEVYFCFPQSDGPDYALKYDYYAGQWSTTGAQYTAGASVKRPQSGLAYGALENWTIFGTMQGTVLTYGMTDEPVIYSNGITLAQSGNSVTASAAIFTMDMVNSKSIQFPDLSVQTITAYTSPTQVTVSQGNTWVNTSFNIIPVIWHRLGQPYASVIQSGIDNFGNSSGEKDLESLLVGLGSKSPNTQLFVEVCGTINPNNLLDDGSTAPTLGSKLLTNPKVQNVVSCTPFIQNYFQHRITINGMDNPAELVLFQYNIAGVDSKNFVQR
jgi:hypothetical protein